MFNVIIVNSQSDEVIQCYEKKETPKLIQIEELFSSKYNARENTIIFHNINLNEIEISGVQRILDNSDFIIGENYNRTIYLPIFNIFNGLIGNELISISDFIFKKENNYEECIFAIEEIFNKMKPDLLKFIIHQKKLRGYLKYNEVPKKFLNIRNELKNQVDKRQRFLRKNSNNNLKFIINFNNFEKYLFEEGFLNIENISIAKLKNIEILKDQKNEDLKMFATLTKFYEGFIETENCSLINEYMNFLDYPNIYERNNETIFLPFSIMRYFLLFPESIKIKNIYITPRIHSYKDLLNIKSNNELTTQFISIINYKLNYDNMNEFDQNQLQGYLALFLFSTLSHENTEDLKASVMSMKYGKGNFSLNRKELIEDFDDYINQLNLISLN